jgi:phospholipase/lecithinase/hemolysin
LLYAEGGRTFVVLNVPDLGHLPLTSNRPDWRKLSALAEQHNALLAKTVSTLRAQLPGARLVLIDLQAPPLPPGLEMTVPALELLAPGTSTCLFTNPASCPTVSFDVDSRYFYWDAEHPTTATHVLLAGYLLSLVVPSP